MSDRQQFEAVYADHYDSVFRYCLRRSNREDAMDATAETFTVAWRRRTDMPVESELPWLYGIARRVLANQRRTTKRQMAAFSPLSVIPGNAAEEPEPQVIRNQDAREVVEALTRLNSTDRELIRLAGWEELGRDELAFAMRCTPNAVTKRLNRALDHLAHELGVVERSRGRFFRRGKVGR